jgi:hypothetical protein
MMNTVAPIRQALVQALRSNTALKAGLPGDIHEGFAPVTTKRPFLTYNLMAAPLAYLWDSFITEAGFSVFVFAENSVDAYNLDALVFATLHDADLPVSGQSTLICRRVSSTTMVDSDEEGKKIYQVGGIYEIWADQPLVSRHTFTIGADAVLG